VTAKRRSSPARLTDSPPSGRTKDATERAFAIATSLRERVAWSLTSASLHRGWALEIEGEHYRIESHVTAFLGRGREAGFLFGVAIVPARGKRAIHERILSTAWFEGLRARLGRTYADQTHRPDRVNLLRALRGTTDPRTVIDELCRIAAAVNETPPPRRRAKAAIAVGDMKQQRADLWKIIDALGPTGWRISTIGHDRESRVQHDGCQWYVGVGLSALVDSFEKRPGFVGNVNSLSTRGEREKRRNPITRAAALLRKSGYRRLHETHYSRWHRGLSFRAAQVEIELLERALATVIR
jgi:hypothetical protein